MKKYLLLALVLLTPTLLFAAQISVPSATGYGVVLIGKTNGNYTPVATSTLRINTSDVIEGSNLFFTAARAIAALFAYPFPGNATSTSIAFNGGLTGTLTGTLVGNASTATALAANPTNCSAGNYPLGIDASGNVESCTAAATGGSGTVSTSTNETAGFLAYWTSTSATPALLGKVATSSETCTSPISCTAHTVLTGGGAITIANAAADGSTKGAASFTAADFDASSGNISIDYTNGTAAASGVKGFLTSTDWNTFNNKQATISATWPVVLSGAALSFGWATTSQPASSNVFVSNGTNGFYGVATSSASCTGASGVTCTGFTVINGATTIALSSIPNTSLANSTISGKALGTSLSALTATDGTLTFSCSYNGSAACTAGLNLANANTWTALQTLSAASTTNETVSSFFQLPNATSFSNNMKASLAFDTTSGNLILGTTTAPAADHVVVGSATSTMAWFAMASTSPNFVSGGHMDVEASPLPIVVTGVICHVDGGTSVVVNISNVAGSSDSNTFTCTTTSTQFAITSNNSFAAYAAWRAEIGTVTGSPNYLHLRFIGYRKSD
jgi:hypothetical protein